MGKYHVPKNVSKAPPLNERIAGVTYVTDKGTTKRWNGRRFVMSKEWRRKESAKKRDKYGLAYGKLSSIKHRYGLSKEQYYAMFEEQKYKCKMCEKHVSPLTRDACIDHKPGTGMVWEIRDDQWKYTKSDIPSKNRGILCQKCNRGLVFIEENRDFGNMAMLYLEEND